MAPHGTISRYTNQKCRCARCRAASAEVRRRAYTPRARQARALPPLNADRQRLVEAHLSCAVHSAGAAMRRAEGRCEHGDLLSAAYFGLVCAAATWVEGKGTTFSTWAFFWTRKYVRRFVHDEMRARGYVWTDGGRSLRRVARVTAWPTDDTGNPVEVMARGSVFTLVPGDPHVQ